MRERATAEQLICVLYILCTVDNRNRLIVFHMRIWKVYFIPVRHLLFIFTYMSTMSMLYMSILIYIVWYCVCAARHTANKATIKKDTYICTIIFWLQVHYPNRYKCEMRVDYNASSIFFFLGCIFQ